MQSGLYVTLSGQVALEKRLKTVASNIANMNTIGYRGDGVRFEAQLAKAGDSTVAFAGNGADFISRQSGAVNKTGNPLDVAVQGDAWLAIKTPAGIVYTRDGRLTINETGEVTTLNGFSVLDAPDRKETSLRTPKPGMNAVALSVLGPFVVPAVEQEWRSYTAWLPGLGDVGSSGARAVSISRAPIVCPAAGTCLSAVAEGAPTDSPGRGGSVLPHR